MNALDEAEKVVDERALATGWVEDTDGLGEALDGNLLLTGTDLTAAEVNGWLAQVVTVMQRGIDGGLPVEEAIGGAAFKAMLVGFVMGQRG